MTKTVTYHYRERLSRGVVLFSQQFYEVGLVWYNWGDKERCKSGRIGTPGKCVWRATVTEGSNPSLSAKVKRRPLKGRLFTLAVEGSCELVRVYIVGSDMCFRCLAGLKSFAFTEQEMGEFFLLGRVEMSRKTIVQTLNSLT